VDDAETIGIEEEAPRAFALCQIEKALSAVSGGVEEVLTSELRILGKVMAAERVGLFGFDHRPPGLVAACTAGFAGELCCGLDHS
jgi:hypothetical protein